MKITVVILCSTDELIKKCLSSIPDNVEILVVLNNPSKNVIDIVNSDCRAKVIRNDTSNLGLLRQLATENVITPGIFYLDSDCILNENTIEYVSEELDKFDAVSVPMRYMVTNFETHIVSRCREYTTPDRALLMPAAFRINLQSKIGGYLYDKRLEWGEDSDQRKRLADNNIPFTISKGLVWHKALSIYEDAKSARKLGFGRWIQEINGFAHKRNLVKDLSIIREIKNAYKCAKKVGVLAGIYHFLVWRIVYKYGYWKEVLSRHRNYNGN